MDVSNLTQADAGGSSSAALQAPPLAALRAHHPLKDALVRPYILAILLAAIGIGVHALAYRIRLEQALIFESPMKPREVNALLPVFGLLQLLGFSLLGLLGDPRDQTRGLLMGRALLGALATGILVLAALGAMNTKVFPRSAVLVAGALNALTSSLLLLVLQRVSLKPLRLLLVGGNADSLARVREKMASSPRMARSSFQSHVLSPEDLEAIARKDVPENLMQTLADRDIDDVVLVHEERPEDRLIPILCSRESHARRLYVVPSVYDVAISRQVSGFVAGDLRLLEVESPLDRWDYRLFKRGLDLAGTLLILALTLPVILLISLLIFVTCGRPVLYSQVRVGRRGRAFRIYKFRTMIRDAERSTGAVLATEKDPRVTPIGRFLRATRIDELPQLWNVLTGAMSLIGPRPERPELAAAFSRDLPSYDLRHRVKPGLTGLAQVAGNYSTSPEDKLRFDLAYVFNYSPILDIALFLRTLNTVIFRRGQ